jgi:virginiamycin A acetyltransferase
VKVIKKILQQLVLHNNTFIDGNCEIGEYTYIGRSVSIVKSKIGRYSTIGNYSSIGQGERDYKQIALSGQLYDFNRYDKYTQGECVIGNDVLLGVDVIVTRGVIIGDGVIVGANSVVTKDIPDYAIVVGSPAKVIKYRFNQEKIQKIKESKWWDYDLEKAKKIVTKLEEELTEND